MRAASGGLGPEASLRRMSETLVLLGGGPVCAASRHEYAQSTGADRGAGRRTHADPLEEPSIQR